MCALAEILIAKGAIISGSDTAETFYTDKILKELGIQLSLFAETELRSDLDLVIHSAAYDEENSVMASAAAAGIPKLSYPEALGELSMNYDAVAVAGVHGKTTTTAMIGTLIKSLGIQATVIVGSAVAGFSNRSTWIGGDRFLIAETCEYRRHFLHFHPRHIVLTAVESDHQDYFPDYESIRSAFMEFVTSLPENGKLIYCHDDFGARDVAIAAGAKRPDIRLIPYGESAPGRWAVSYGASAPGINKFRIAAFETEFTLGIPGRHIALDAAAALVLTHCINPNFDVETAVAALYSFRGSRRRCEIVGGIDGILVMDDYAHHPTAIKATLKGLKDFYPDRRFVVDFMPHTYSRTAALMDDFAGSFVDADILILHPIYASARESFTRKVSGRELAEQTARQRKNGTTFFHEEFDQTVQYLRENLLPTDLFITLGAGNNWSIGQELLEVWQ